MEPKHLEALYPDTARFAEIDKLVSYIKEGNSCQVVGLPGSGRSNLLGSLAYNKHIRRKHMGDVEKTSHFVLVDFAEVRKKPLFDAVKLIFLTLLDSLRERKMLTEYNDAKEDFKEAIGFQDEMVLFQGLKRAIDMLANEKKLNVIFLFDRFDEYVPMLTDDFFANLRVLRNRAKYRFSVIFTLNKPLEDLLDPSLFADFQEFITGHVIYLSPYDEPSITFRIGYLEKLTGKTVADKQKQEILSLTGGHWRLTRLAIEALFAEDHVPSHLEAFLLEQKKIRGALLEIWHALSPSEQDYLLEGSKGQESDKEDASYLTKVGLLKDGHVQIPLLQAFLTTLQPPSTQSESEQIVYDEESNTIRKGDNVLSDYLTASEFRLLKYLLYKKDRIVDRDEIINVVWSDLQSTAGITDQAVDQLIFRLRRKIEEDPNNPEHLITVKGRGVKFLP